MNTRRLALGSIAVILLGMASPALNGFALLWEGEPPGEPRLHPARTEPRPPEVTQGRFARKMRPTISRSPRRLRVAWPFSRKCSRTRALD